MLCKTRSKTILKMHFHIRLTTLPKHAQKHGTSLPSLQQAPSNP